MRVLREPLLHFFVLGAIVFAVFSVMGDEVSEVAPDRVEVTPAVRAALARQFEQTWKRAPTASEISALVDGHVDQEILVREAVLLGLDRDDAIVRQRLVLKMQFLLEAGAATTEPDDALLAAFLQDNAAEYAQPAQLSFEQVLVRRASSDAETVLAALQAGEDVAALGAPTLLPPALEDAAPRAVDSVFGEGFFEQLAALSGAGWVGPVTSGYGTHLVRVTEYAPARARSLDEVREAVTRDWIAATTAEGARQRMEALRARYEIVRDDEAERDR